MPTLKMKNFRILQVVDDGTGKKANVGTFYVKADVEDPKNGTKEFNPVNRFGKSFVNTIRACFPSTGTYLGEDGSEQPWNGINDKLAADITREEIEKAIPVTHRRIPNAVTVSVPLGGEFARKRGQAGVDRDGNPYAADDLILGGDGTFTVYETQDVLTSMEYVMVPATDANGNLIPNPKYDPNDVDCAEEEWLQTVAKDEHGVPKMREAEGWESKPQADNIKRAFMISVEAAIAKCIADGHPERIPYRYAEARERAGVGATTNPNPDNTAQTGSTAGTAGAGAPGATPTF